MKSTPIGRASLDEIRKKKDRGELSHDPHAPIEPEPLGVDFWAGARIVDRRAATRSVHLKVDVDVFDFFKADGKGHLTRMQNVLRAYVRAHTGV